MERDQFFAIDAMGVLKPAKTCPVCKGSGYKVNREDDVVHCSRCQGAGNVPLGRK